MAESNDEELRQQLRVHALRRPGAEARVLQRARAAWALQAPAPASWPLGTVLALAAALVLLLIDWGMVAAGQPRPSAQVASSTDAAYAFPHVPHQHRASAAELLAAIHALHRYKDPSS